MTKNEIIAKLEAGVCRVTFSKKDGSVVTRNFTLYQASMPEQDTPSGRKENPDKVNVWDVDANGWRSFMMPNFIGLE